VSTRLRDLTRTVLRGVDEDGLTVPELLVQVRAHGGGGVSRAALERSLAADPACTAREVNGRQRWVLDAEALADDGSGAATLGADTALDGASVGGTIDRERSLAGLAALELRPWQAEALAVWSQTLRGVVEAVTGTGKTRLALAAVRLVVERGGVVLILVPTLGLLDQWVRELAAVVPRERIGRLGGGRSDDLDHHRVLVATPQSAAELPIEPPFGTVGLLVADEAHRLGAPTWAGALKDAFELRLALTATFEREDDGLIEVLEPYFGGVVHRYGYAEAARDGTIAPFDVTLVGVPLTHDEQRRHDDLDARVRRLTASLAASGALPREPRALIAALAAIVSEAERSGRDGAQSRAAREYLSAVRERRAVAAGARRKTEVVAALAPALAGHRTLVFTDTVEQAEAVVGRLRARGAPAATLHGELDARARRSRLARFGRGELLVLAAPRVLDEGVDLPDADVAVALSAFRTRRHLVQRLGRVLRLKADGRSAHLVLLHASGTLEDPSRGGHHGFLEQVAGVARSRLDVELADPDGSASGPGAASDAGGALDPGPLAVVLGRLGARSASDRPFGSNLPNEGQRHR
jgi:superfamily II DNA or RNA helicase